MSTFRLVNIASGIALAVGHTVVTFRGERGCLKGIRPPQHSNSSGKVIVKLRNGQECEFYPSVIGATFLYTGARHV